MRPGVACHRLPQEPIARVRAYTFLGLFPEKGDPWMPVWLEILLNVIAFAGFIGIAKYHKAPGENLPDR